MYRTRMGWGSARAPAAPAGPGYGFARGDRWDRALARLGQGPTPDVVTWDSTLSLSSGRQPAQNNGCPDGYFAQFVGRGEFGAVSVPGKSYALRCRLMATTTAETIQEESGITAREALDVYAGALADTGKQLAHALSWTPWIVGGAAVVIGLVSLAYLVRR